MPGGGREEPPDSGGDPLHGRPLGGEVCPLHAHDHAVRGPVQHDQADVLAQSQLLPPLPQVYPDVHGDREGQGQGERKQW